ncbi:MAG: tRNA (adenosine(37)-N6)-threonylcarbamoyltransferase complex ATPase subunit type 1 TsaE [Phycisphaeraceae bacterium]|nr:tRNA (adenosine(37)-N6)-threonylcarbamoyltransferase complex ATPase subunit type 1 TsaE [Phycisphaeraceae bacterium]
MVITHTSNSEDDTIALGAALARILRPGDIVGLHAELGAGKTRLVRGIARGMGIAESIVSSPTFVIVHEYRPDPPHPPSPPTQPTAGPSLFHVDAYRLAGADELDSLGWDRVTDGSGVVVIEWAKRIEPALPAGQSRADIHLTPTGETSRLIKLDLPDSWSARPGFAALLPPGAPLPAGWVRCSITGRPVPPDSPTFPFADERARMADLNRWLTGAYRVSRDILPDDADDPDLQGPEAHGPSR